MQNLTGGIDMICDNCLMAMDETKCRPMYWDSYPIEEWHRCRADSTSCLDGVNCPDYIDECDCSVCFEAYLYNRREDGIKI